MKIFKKILTGILTLIITICLTMLLLSLNINKTLIDMMSETVVADVITERVMGTLDNNLDKLTDEKQEKIKEAIEKNKTLKKLSDEMIQETIAYIAEEKDLTDLSIEGNFSDVIKENKQLIEEELGYSISDSELENIITDIDSELDINQIYKEEVTKLDQNFSEDEKALIKAYSTFKSQSFKMIMIIISLISLVLIALLKKSFYKWIPNLTTALIISGVNTMILSGLLDLMIGYITSEYKFNGKVDINPILISGIIFVISGIVIIIIYQILKKVFIKKQENLK